MKAGRETTRVAPGRPRERLHPLGEEVEPLHRALKEIKATFSIKPGDGDTVEREELIDEMRKLRENIKEASIGTQELKSRLEEFSAVRGHLAGWEERRASDMGAIDRRLDTIDAGLRGLTVGVDVAPLVSKLKKTEEVLRGDTNALRRTTVEGFQRLSDDLTVASALRPPGPTIHDEMAVGALSAAQRPRDPHSEWTTVRGGRGRPR